MAGDLIQDKAPHADDLNMPEDGTQAGGVAI